jgi:hypothetical protein
LGSHRSTAELSAQPTQEDGGLEAIQLLECSFDHTVWLAEQSQQQVLGIELVVSQALEELLDTRQRFSGFICESFERDQDNPPRPLRLLWRLEANLDSQIIRVSAK